MPVITVHAKNLYEKISRFSRSVDVGYVKFNFSMSYEGFDDFDIDSWREHVTRKKKATQKFNVDMLRQIEFDGQLLAKPLAKLICEKIGCGRSCAYQLMREAVKAKIFRFNGVLETYSKI